MNQYRDFEKPFFLVIKTKTEGVKYEPRKLTLVGEFKNDRDTINGIFEYIFSPSEYMQRAIGGTMPENVATLRAYQQGALIFEQTRYFDKIGKK